MYNYKEIRNIIYLGWAYFGLFYDRILIKSIYNIYGFYISDNLVYTDI